MNPKQWFCGTLCAVCCAVSTPPSADKPLPSPDTSKLAPPKPAAGREPSIDKARAQLIGPPLAEVYADMGALYLRAGFKDAAAIAFYDASQVNPQDGRWFYLRGVVARDLKQNADARANFEAALAIDKVYLPIQYRLSDTLIDLGDAEGARKLLEGTTREHPDQAVAFAMLGQVNLRLKRYSQAVENLKEALRLEPQANQLRPLAESRRARQRRRPRMPKRRSATCRRSSAIRSCSACTAADRRAVTRRCSRRSSLPLPAAFRPRAR
jgi:tetratricopeptide (TPR) repeat protein